MSPGESGGHLRFSGRAGDRRRVETVDFINVAVVESDVRVTPSNVVDNTVVLTKVSDNTSRSSGPATGSQFPLTGLRVFGLLLVALGASCLGSASCVRVASRGARRAR